MSRKIILIKQELLLLVYELNRSGLLAENEKIRPILAQLDRKSGSAGMPRPSSYAVFCLKKKMGRALCETIAVVLVIGNAPVVGHSICSQGYSLAAVIANEFGDAAATPFFFNDTSTTEIYTLSLHDALPI